MSEIADEEFRKLKPWMFNSFFYVNEKNKMEEHMERLRAGGLRIDKRPKRINKTIVGYNIFVK